MPVPNHAWMVRAGNENELPALFEENSLVAIGWTEMGDLSSLTSRADFKRRYEEVYPEHSKHRRAVNAGQLYRFVREIEVGDYVLTYIEDSRELLIGRVDGDYAHCPDAIGGDYNNVRPVEWLTKASRDDFTAPARNSMGSTLTVFSLDDYVDAIHRLVTGEDESAEELEEEAEEAPPFYDEVKSQADELIADRIHQLDPYDFQDLVAGVLRAMGFEAESTPPGPDRGIDIVAHPDAFGFEQPRIRFRSSTGSPRRVAPRCDRSSERYAPVRTASTCRPAALRETPSSRPSMLTSPSRCSTARRSSSSS